MVAETINTYTFTPGKRSVFSPQNLKGDKGIKKGRVFAKTSFVRRTPASKSGRRG